MKQLYFINEKEAVKFLVDFVLPFLNADTPTVKELNEIKTIIDTDIDLPESENKSRNLFRKVLQTKYLDSLSAFSNLYSKCRSYVYYNLKEEDYLNISDYEDLRNYLLWLLKTPLNKKLSEHKLINYIDELNYYCNERTTVDWRCYGLTFSYVDQTFEFNNVYEVIKKVCSEASIKCLYSDFNYDSYNWNKNKTNVIRPDYIEDLFTNSKNMEEVREKFNKIDNSEPIDNYIINGEGFKHIGLCPVCEKLFHKTRHDKEYCSAKCAKVGTARKRRNKC